MNRNVDVKVRVGDPEALLKKVKEEADGDPEELTQKDVFFHSEEGRQEANRLLALFAVPRSDLISEAYIDLLEVRSGA